MMVVAENILVDLWCNINTDNETHFIEEPCLLPCGNLISSFNAYVIAKILYFLYIYRS